MKTILPNDSDDALTTTFDVPEQVYAPVKAGDRIGGVTLTLEGREIGTVDLLAARDIERNTFLFLVGKTGEFLTGTYVKVVIVLTVVFFVGYVLIAVRMERARKAQLRRQKRRAKGERFDDFPPQQ